MTMQASDGGVVKILVLFSGDSRNQIGVMNMWVAARDVLPPHSACLVMSLTNCIVFSLQVLFKGFRTSQI